MTRAKRNGSGRQKRWPAMQNIPIRTELGVEIRAAFLEAGERAADYRQTAMRILERLTEEKEKER